MKLDTSSYNAIFWTGIAGLVGALLVGIGEFTMQFSLLGDYGDEAYRFFADVSKTRLSAGHFFSAFAAPLYILGYWHLGQMFVRGGSKAAGWTVTLLGGYGFVVGNAWLGGRIYLALTAHTIAGESNPATAATLSSLLSEFSEHNEPLVNALRIAMVVVSVIWIWRISAGQTLYPRWMAVFSPGLLLGVIFAIYLVVPVVGVWLLPAAMNVAHLVVFALSVAALRRHQRSFG